MKNKFHKPPSTMPLIKETINATPMAAADVIINIYERPNDNGRQNDAIATLQTFLNINPPGNIDIVSAVFAGQRPDVTKLAGRRLVLAKLVEMGALRIDFSRRRYFGLYFNVSPVIDSRQALKSSKARKKKCANAINQNRK